MRPPPVHAPPEGVTPLTNGDPARLGRYRLVGRLGAGSMGVVYAAVDRRGQPLAVKLMHSRLATDPDFRARFTREIAMVRRVRGACLPEFLDADTNAPLPWLATEYVPGQTLREHVTAQGPLTGGTLVAFAAGLAEALTAVHTAGIVHRDLKPGNVVLSPSGPKVLDSGIARALAETALTRTGGLSGTPGWESPERYSGAPLDAASDMFAWGGLVLMAATGHPPFGRGYAAELARRVLHEEPDLTGLPEPLHSLVHAALAKEPSHRPTAAQALARLTNLRAPGVPSARVLTSLLDQAWHVGTAPDTSGWALAAPRQRRHLLPALAAAAALALVVSLGWVAGNRFDATERDTTAEQGTGDGDNSDGADPQDATPAYEDGTQWPWGIAVDHAEHDGWESRAEVTELAPDLAELIPERDVGDHLALFELTDGSGNGVTLAMFDVMSTPDGPEFGGYVLGHGDAPPITSDMLTVNGPTGWSGPLRAAEISAVEGQAAELRFAHGDHEEWEEPGEPAREGRGQQHVTYNLLTVEGAGYREDGTGPPPVSVCYVPGERTPGDDYWKVDYEPGEGFSTDYESCV